MASWMSPYFCKGIFFSLFALLIRKETEFMVRKAFLKALFMM